MGSVTAGTGKVHRVAAESLTPKNSERLPAKEKGEEGGEADCGATITRQRSSGSQLEDGGGEVDEVALVAGNLGEAGGIAGALTKLGDRGTGERAFRDTGEMFGGNRDRFLITAETVEQAHEHLSGGLAILHAGIAAERVVGFGLFFHRIGRRDLGPEMGQRGVDVTAE